MSHFCWDTLYSSEWNIVLCIYPLSTHIYQNYLILTKYFRESIEELFFCCEFFWCKKWGFLNEKSLTKYDWLRKFILGYPLESKNHNFQNHRQKSHKKDHFILTAKEKIKYIYRNAHPINPPENTKDYTKIQSIISTIV